MSFKYQLGTFILVCAGFAGAAYWFQRPSPDASGSSEFASTEKPECTTTTTSTTVPEAPPEKPDMSWLDELIKSKKPLEPMLSEKGYGGLKQTLDCNCTVEHLSNPFLQLEDAKACGDDRDYYEKNWLRYPESYRKYRSVSAIKKEFETQKQIALEQGQSLPPPFQEACMTYIMRQAYVEEPSDDARKMNFFATCNSPEAAPTPGNFKSCVSANHANVLYNVFYDVFSCLGVRQQELVAKIMVETQFHMNVFNTPKLMNDAVVGGDSGLGQLTGPAIGRVNEEFQTYKDRILQGKHPACARLRTLNLDLLVPHKDMKTWWDFEKNQATEEVPEGKKDTPTVKYVNLGNRCELIHSKRNPLLNAFYTALLADTTFKDTQSQMRRRNGYYLLLKAAVGTQSLAEARGIDLADYERRLKILDAQDVMDAREEKAALSKEASEDLNKIGIDVEGIHGILGVQGYNAGPGGAVVSLVEYLRQRIAAIDKIEKEFKAAGKKPKAKDLPLIKRDDFNFWTNTVKYREFLCREEDRKPEEVCKEVIQPTKVSFPAYLRACQKSGARGYANIVANRAKNLEKIFKEGACAPANFLSLCPASHRLNCDKGGQCDCIPR